MELRLDLKGSFFKICKVKKRSLKITLAVSVFSDLSGTRQESQAKADKTLQRGNFGWLLSSALLRKKNSYIWKLRLTKYSKNKIQFLHLFLSSENEP